MLITLYRISDGGYKKDKLPFADKFYCLENYLRVFGTDGLIIFADNCRPETMEKLYAYNVDVRSSNIGSSAQSWKMVAQYALNHFSDSDYLYFLEDDYLHKPGAKQILLEGLQIGDYVTLYDHPDKYIDKAKGGNPLVSNGGEATRVMLTNSCHWKQTNSTTMTFATQLATLRADWDIWDKYTRGTHPHDNMIFYHLQGLKKLKFKLFGKRRILINPLPGYSTHVETQWLSPLTHWADV